MLIKKVQLDATIFRHLVAITNKMQLSNGIFLFHSTLIVQHVSSVMSLIIRNLNCICSFWFTYACGDRLWTCRVNPLNPELNPICYLLALLAHHFLHVSRIRVKSLTLRLLMSYIYGARILDVSRSQTTTQHSR